MAIIISNETIAPAVYGAEEAQPVANSVLDANIQFGKGSIAKVLEKVGENTNDPNIYFGHDASTGAGIVVADGKLMSSKVLDVKVIPEVPEVKGDNGTVTTAFKPASLKITYVQDGSVGETTLAISNSNLETRVKALEDFNKVADADDKINTVKDILDWFDTVSEASTNYTVTIDGSIMDLGKGQAGLLTSVARNKKDIVDIKATIDSLDVEDTSVGTGNVVVKYKQENGKVTISDVSVTETSALFTPAAENTSANLSVGDASALLTGESISAIKNYVDAVAAANQEAITINNDSSAYLTVDASNDHLIGVNVTTLGDAVGLTKSENGTWVTPEGVTAVAPGLATAADVAAEIVADEKVIAAALNEHELAINALESKEITVTHSTGNITDLSTGKLDASGALTVDGSIITSNTYVPALENIAFNGTGATTTYTIKNGDTSVVETIVSVDASVVITQLLNIIQAERVRANNAEAALQHQLNDHENRLKWINLGY